MFFGLLNAPASFQSYINKILTIKFNIFVNIYFNDIFVYMKNVMQDHRKVSKQMLNVLQKYKVFANLKKYQFHNNKVYFLTYIILAYRVKIENK